ncbi:hypothetical protein [Actinomadura sp. KC216]|nr:hypothetical protein [Actinomadura sp. KC216]
MAENEGLPVEPKNGADRTVENEEEVLRELYGIPDENGFFRGVGS